MVHIFTKFVIWTWPLCSRYLLIQNASSLSVWLRFCIHIFSWCTLSCSNLIHLALWHLLRCLLSLPHFLQLGQQLSRMSWILAVYFCIAHTPIACLDNYSWKPFGLLLRVHSKAFQSTSWPPLYRTVMLPPCPAWTKLPGQCWMWSSCHWSLLLRSQTEASVALLGGLLNRELLWLPCWQVCCMCCWAEPQVWDVPRVYFCLGGFQPIHSWWKSLGWADGSIVVSKTGRLALPLDRLAFNPCFLFVKRIGCCIWFSLWPP